MFSIVSCKPDCEHIITGSDADILSCKATIGTMVFQEAVTNDKIDIELPANLKDTPVTVEVTISEGATIVPDPSVVTDWTNPQKFTVTSITEEAVKEYTIIVIYNSEIKVYNSSVRIGSQKDLDSFGANQYVEVGSLYLYSGDINDSIRDLSSLSSIEKVRSELEISEVAASSISFPNLKDVGNFDMHSINAQEVLLPNLETVSGRMRIGNNDSGPLPTSHKKLKYIYMPSLKSIGRSFIVNFCSALEHLETGALQSVGEDIDIVGGLFTDLSFISSLKSVPGYLRVYSELKSLDGFAIESIGTGLYLQLDGVKSLEPLSILKKVKVMSISQGAEIKSFKGLENIDVQTLEVKGFSAVTSTEYLPIRDNMNFLSISYLENLTDLKGLEKIKTIGVLMLVSCPKVTDIDAIRGIENIDDLHIVLMEGIDALPQFKFTKANKIRVSMMTKLSDISGLSSLTQVSSLQIDNLLGITSLKGLNNLSKITNGGIIIGNCVKIKTLNELSNLKEIVFAQQSDQIGITMNSELIDYTGVAELLLKYWNDGGGKNPRVSLRRNKYNPTYQQLKDGQYIMP